MIPFMLPGRLLAGCLSSFYRRFLCPLGGKKAAGCTRAGDRLSHLTEFSLSHRSSQSGIIGSLGITLLSGFQESEIS